MYFLSVFCILTSKYSFSYNTSLPRVPRGQPQALGIKPAAFQLEVKPSEPPLTRLPVGYISLLVSSCPPGAGTPT